MFIYKTAKLAPVWTIILKIPGIFVHQILTEHAPQVFLCFTLVYILLVTSVTFTNGQTEWSQSTNFNRMQDGAWL